MAGDMHPRSRYRPLTNPVAEFLETGQSGAIGGPAPRRPNSDFVPEMDKFVPKGSHSIQDYHQESYIHMREFQLTLRKFHEHLEKRKERDSSVELKRPDEYTFKDVLEITTKLHEDHKSASEVKSCAGIIRKMFRRAGEKRSVLENLLSFVPADTYGSVICGGFTMILTAAQRTHELREEICEAIGEIPKQLAYIHRQLLVHYASPNLRTCADGILVAIFVLLERIVSELTKSLTKKVFLATLKGSDYADDVKDAIKTLATRVDEFNSEARICDSERLGEVKQDGVRTRIAVESIKELLRQTKQEKEALYERIRFLESQGIQDKSNKALVSGLRQDMVQEELQTAVYNAFYGLFMAHPSIDDRTGKPTVEVQNFGFKVLQNASQRSEAQPNFIDVWLQELSQPGSDSSCIEKCIENVWDLSLKEMDRVKYITASTELQAWLRSSQSTTLVIDPETRPEEVFNALTSSVAIITHTLTLEARFPVLSFFCALISNELHDEQFSGPMGMLNSLNAQLMDYCKGRGLRTESHEQLEKPRFRHKSQTRVTKSLELLESLLKDLPENDPVVIVIDSVCRLLGSRPLANEAIEGLLQVVGRANRTIKMLITSPWSTDELGLNSFTLLFIPDYIDGDRESLNLELMQNDAAQAASASKAEVESSDNSDSTLDSTSESEEDWSIVGSSRR